MTNIKLIFLNQVNKQGLEFFSAELLKASAEIEHRELEKGKVEHYEFDMDWTDDNADFYFNHIELTSAIKSKEGVIPSYEESWKDKLVAPLIIGIALSILVIFIIGFITTLKWLF